MKETLIIVLVRFSIKSFPYMTAISIAVAIMAVNTKIPYNNFGLIGTMGLIVLILTMAWFNSLPDHIYNQAKRRRLDDIDQGLCRAKCIGVSLCLSTTFILTFSSMSVGHPMTYPSADVHINGQTVSGFHFINILESHIFR